MDETRSREWPTALKEPVGFRREQVVEIITEGLDEGGFGFGSGYRIGPTLVLTARHVVSDAAATITVRFGGVPGSPTVGGLVVWRSSAPGVDLALVRLRWEDGFTGPRCDPPSLASLLGDSGRDAGFFVRGFPRYNAGLLPGSGRPFRDSDDVAGSARPGPGGRRSSRTRPFELGGLVRPGANTKSRLIDLYIAGQPDLPPETWSGLSGAAVFVHDSLVGVVGLVTDAEGRARRLRASPLTAALAPATIPLKDFFEPPGSAERFHKLLVADGCDTRLEIARRRAAYADIVLTTARRCPELHDRGPETRRIHEWFGSGPPYLQLIGNPWAGKTALLAGIAVRPPERVDIVAYFASQTEGFGEAGFWRGVCDQLAAVADEERRTWTKEDFDGLWRRAHALCARRRRTLVLLVDGLDELPDGERRSVLERLPVDADAKVLVASRPNPDDVDRLGAGHPLADPDLRVLLRLEPSRYATDLHRASEDDLAAALHDRLARQVVGLLATAGPLSIDDLRELASRLAIDVDRFEITRILTRESSSRILVATASWDAAIDAGRRDHRPSTRPSFRAGRGDEKTDARFALAHSTLLDQVKKLVEEPVQRRWLDAVIAWGKEYEARGWPADTPAFLVQGYTALLVDAGDPDRALRVLTSERWRRAVHARTGADLLTSSQIERAISVFAAQSPPDLAGVMTLAAQRERVDRLYEYYPENMVKAWAVAGHSAHAEHMARQRREVEDRARLLLELADIARAAQDADGDERAARLVALTVDLVEEIRPPDVLARAVERERHDFPAINRPRREKIDWRERSVTDVASLHLDAAALACALGVWDAARLALRSVQTWFPLIENLSQRAELTARSAELAVDAGVVDLIERDAGGPTPHRSTPPADRRLREVARTADAPADAGEPAEDPIHRDTGHPEMPGAGPSSAAETDASTAARTPWHGATGSQPRVKDARTALDRGDLESAASILRVVASTTRMGDAYSMMIDWDAASIAMAAARRFPHESALEDVLEAAEAVVRQKALFSYSASWSTHVGSLGLERGSAGNAFASLAQWAFEAGQNEQIAAAVEPVWRAATWPSLTAALALAAVRAGADEYAHRMLPLLPARADSYGARLTIAKIWAGTPHWRAAVELVRTTQARWETCQTLAEAAPAAIREGAMTEALSMLSELRPERSAAPLTQLWYQCLAGSAHACAEKKYWRLSEELVKSIDSEAVRARLWPNLAAIANEQGETGRAEALLRSGLESARGLADPDERARALAQWAVVRRTTGGVEDAVLVLAESARVARLIADPAHQSQCCLALLETTADGTDASWNLSWLENQVIRAVGAAGDRRTAQAVDLAKFAYDLGRPDLAARVVTHLDEWTANGSNENLWMITVAGLPARAVHAGHPEQAEILLGVMERGTQPDFTEIAVAAVQARQWPAAARYLDRVPERSRGTALQRAAEAALPEFPEKALAWVLDGLRYGLTAGLLATTCRLDPAVLPVAFEELLARLDLVAPLLLI